MNITTQTKIFGSFSEAPGNNGTKFFNTAFETHGIDAIYLPIKCFDTEQAINLFKGMNFTGAAFARPHKTAILSFLDEIDDDAKELEAVNTVVRINDKLKGYNTDWIGVHYLLQSYENSHLYIYGKGGFSKAVQYACNKLLIEYTILNRNDPLPNDFVFNASPVELSHPFVIDGRPFTETGVNIFKEQAKVQYLLYTGMSYD